MTKALFTEVELQQQFVVLREVMPLQVIEQLAAPAGHLEQPPAGMEILAMRAKVLGQVIDPRGEQRDLHLARASVLIVGFVFGYDFGFYDCWHG